MAESQVPHAYSAEKIAAIRVNLSEARFARFLAKAGGHEQYAIELYLYNARLAKAFLYPLHVVEVTMRNAIDSVLVATYGPDWQHAPQFVTTVLTEDGQSTLAKALLRTKGGQNRNQVVATLTFDFWSNMLRQDYHDLWRTNLTRALPHLPKGETRHDVQVKVKAINDFRNRVAHHEPVLDVSVNDLHAQIVSLVSWREPLMADWLRGHSTLSRVVRTRPRLDGLPPQTLLERVDPAFLTCQREESLLAVLVRSTPQTAAIICIDAAGLPIAAFTFTEIMAFIQERTIKEGGLIDLSEHGIDEFIGAYVAGASWQAIVQTTPLDDAIDILRGPKVRVLVSTDPATGVPTGAIVRAHRRY